MADYYWIVTDFYFLTLAAIPKPFLYSLRQLWMRVVANTNLRRREMVKYDPPHLIFVTLIEGLNSSWFIGHLNSIAVHTVRSRKQMQRSLMTPLAFALNPERFEFSEVFQVLDVGVETTTLIR